jgi:hypothetical protein
MPGPSSSFASFRAVELTIGDAVARESSAARPFFRCVSLERLAAMRCNRSIIRAAAIVGALAATLALASPAQAAAPTYILVSGPGLARPVLLANWRENLVLLSAVVNAPRGQPAAWPEAWRRRCRAARPVSEQVAPSEKNEQDSETEM